MKRYLIIMALIASAATMMYAQNRGPRRGMPAKREPIEFVQPNGDTLTIRLVGDEWHHYRMTVDGYLIDQNDKGYYCYAQYNSKGKIVCTRRKAHNKDKRSKCEQRYLDRYIPNKIQERQEMIENE